MKYAVLILAVVFLAGCNTTASKPKDPCESAPKICWGQSGTSPMDNPVCRQLVECRNWEISEKK